MPAVSELKEVVFLEEDLTPSDASFMSFFLFFAIASGKPLGEVTVVSDMPPFFQTVAGDNLFAGGPVSMEPHSPGFERTKKLQQTNKKKESRQTQ